MDPASEGGTVSVHGSITVQGSIAPAKKPPTKSPPPGATRRAAQNALASSMEDGAMIAGGLLATIAGALSASGAATGPVNTTVLFVLGLTLAAIGKSLPSLLRELRDYRFLLGFLDPQGRGEAESTEPLYQSLPAKESCPLDVDCPKDPAFDGDSVTHSLETLSDGFLLLLSGTAAVVYVVTLSPFYFLVLLGVAFLLKAIVDIAEDWYIADAIPQLKFGGKVGGTPRGPEDMTLFVFGLAAILIASLSNPAASAALGISALGKALPSLAGVKSSGDSNSSGGTSDSYTVTLSIPRQQLNDLTRGR